MEKIKKTKNYWREFILNNKLNKMIFWVISYPDWDGGRFHCLIVRDRNYDVRENLGDFQYVAFEGDATALLKRLNKVFIDLENNREYEITLRDLLEDCFFGN